MNVKTKRAKMRVLLTLVFAVTMFLGMTTSAFAAPPVIGTSTNPATAAVTKVLEMPEGTTLSSTATFSFTAEKVSVDGTAATATNMPSLSIPDITFSNAETAAATPSGGMISLTKETANFVTGSDFPHAGIYVYKITETQSGYTQSTGETMTYSSGEYTVTVYVDNDGSGGLYVRAVGAVVVTPGAPGQAATDKVDATVGGDPDVTGDHSGMVFTNSFLKIPASADQLYISKAVAGPMADQSKYFDFQVTVTKPATVSGTPAYNVQLVSGGSVIAPSTDNALTGATVSGTNITVTSGTQFTIKLKHSERLNFTNLPVGATYTVSEISPTGYTPAVALTVNGASSAITGTANTTLSVPAKMIGESGANNAAYTNTIVNVTPMGISIDNLPFVMMLVIIGGAIAVFAVVRSRKRAHSA